MTEAEVSATADALICALATLSLLCVLEDTTRFAGYEHLLAALRPCVQAALQIKN